jgi:hypothetical protein
MRFRKKPVEIDAIQFTGHNDAEVLAFGDAHGGGLWDPVDRGPSIAMRTVHGETAIARPGDWIIPEPDAGRFYPVKPDIFDATYEAV